jgi:hypothetical protein
LKKKAKALPIDKIAFEAVAEIDVEPVAEEATLDSEESSEPVETISTNRGSNYTPRSYSPHEEPAIKLTDLTPTNTKRPHLTSSSTLHEARSIKLESDPSTPQFIPAKVVADECASPALKPPLQSRSMWSKVKGFGSRLFNRGRSQPVPTIHQTTNDDEDLGQLGCFGAIKVFFGGGNGGSRRHQFGQEGDKARI